jgi:hypothetical protein
MVSSKPKNPPIVGTILFGVIALLVAIALIYTGWYLYSAAAKPLTDFYAKLGELTLQLGIIVIVGALVKVVLDWGTSQRTRYFEKLEARKEFMRRVRAMHVTIQNSRDLMNAHQSAKTWSEQSRRLMELRPEIEEISEDLRASHSLFAKQTEIVEGLEAIIVYLQEAGQEYVRCHEAVDTGYKTGKTLLEVIDLNNMVWVHDFTQRGKKYEADYEKNLIKCKGSMRLEIYGGYGVDPTTTK